MSFLGGLLGGVAGFLTGGPVGALVGAAGGLQAGSAGGAVAAGVNYRTPVPQAGGTSSAALPGVIGGPLGAGAVRIPTVSGYAGLPAPFAATTTDMPGTGAGAGTAVAGTTADAPTGAIVPCNMKGHHLNKSTYYTHSFGLFHKHEKGSTCVKNRRMNVGNARALRHALRRARGFEKLAMRTIRILHPTKRGRFGGFKTRRRSR